MGNEEGSQKVQNRDLDEIEDDLEKIEQELKDILGDPDDGEEEKEEDEKSGQDL